MKLDPQWPKRLFSRRLIFVMGKGGVGKTTISVLLGLAAGRMGKKTLLVELGDSDAMAEIFSRSSLNEAPTRVGTCLWVSRVNARSELKAYIHAHVPSQRIAHRITQSRLFEYLFAATPGLKEVMSLGRIWRWERQKDESGRPEFDLIIVDSPASGHALSLLRLPAQLVQMIRVGPLASQIYELQRMLQDETKTCLALVTLPEELPVNETIELYAAAVSQLHIPAPMVFVNCVWPSSYTPDHIKTILQLQAHPPSAFQKSSDIGALIQAAHHHIVQRMRQETYVLQIQASLNCPLVEIPFWFTNNLVLADMNQMSIELMQCPNL